MRFFRWLACLFDTTSLIKDEAPRRLCHLCKGRGQVYEMDGWAAPAWDECTYCRGTGYAPKDHPCGCQSVNGFITSCYGGHGHTSGGPA